MRDYRGGKFNESEVEKIIGSPVGVCQSSEEIVSWDYVHKVNVRATMKMLSLCMPFLQQTRGSVAVLSSAAGEKPWQGYMAYNAAMASLNMMVRCAALENAPYEVRVNAIAPGAVRTKNDQ